MFYTYLYADGKKYYRGQYKTYNRALSYGQKDFNDVDNAFFIMGHKDRQHDLFIESASGEKLYKFSYKYL